MSKVIEDLLRYDAIADAEKVYGPLTTTNDQGFAYALDMTKSKTDLLKRELLAAEDTYFNMPVADYLKVLCVAGFKEVAVVEFVSSKHAHEKLYLYWHDDGLLLTADTFTWADGRTTINSALMFYNLLIDFTKPAATKISNGYFVSNTNVWVGQHDVREALRHKLAGLRSVGSILKDWVESKHLYLAHYEDLKGIEVWRERSQRLQAINKERLDLFPADIEQMLLKVYKNA